MTSTCTTLMVQLRTQWDYTTAGVLADAFAENDDPLNAALWYILAEPHSDTRRLAYAAECEREVSCSSLQAGGRHNGCVSGKREYRDKDGKLINKRCGLCDGTGYRPRDAARAEFVRVQVELAKTPRTVNREKMSRIVGEDGRWDIANYGPLPAASEIQYRIEGNQITAMWEEDNQRWEYLRRRERGLWSAVYDSYQLPWRFAGYERGIPQLEDMSRGFVFRATCPAALWLAHGPEIRLCQPVELVKLTTDDREALALQLVRSRHLNYATRVNHVGMKEGLELLFPGISFELPTDYNPAFDYMDASPIDR